MTQASPDSSVTEPFPIFHVAGKHLLYDINVISYIRKTYNICGVLIGGLPQAPQQNVFLGTPLELMPEEARLLVEKRVAYVVEDIDAHKNGFLTNGVSEDERRAFQLALRRQGQAAVKEVNKRTDERKQAALQQKGGGGDSWNDIPDDMLRPTSGKGKKNRSRRATPSSSQTQSPALTPTPNSERQEYFKKANEDESLFGNTADVRPTKFAPTQAPSNAQSRDLEAYAITPTTSYPPLRSTFDGAEIASDLPEVPQSYQLYKHVHEQGYFLSPGLRFGCQYTAYPGDSLRFHSHFLCNGMDWDQEFDLLDIVGGGRLGTGVKKGFLIGGEEKRDKTNNNRGHGEVRTFCIEWGGM